MYGSEELRRLAFVRIAHLTGLPLETAAAVLDAPGPQGRQTVREDCVIGFDQAHVHLPVVDHRE
jgi:hypothetical protein